MKEIEQEHVLVLGVYCSCKSFELGYSRTNEQPCPLIDSER